MLKKWTKTAVLVIVVVGLWGCQKPKGGDAGVFDPKNLDQLADIYTRSNYFKDFSLFEKYNLQGKAGLQYTQAIVEQSADTVRWQAFLQRVEKRRQALEKSQPLPDSST